MTLLGVINGSVNTDSEHRTLWGRKALVAALVVGVGVVVVQTLTDGARAGGALVALLMPLLLIFLMFGLIYALALGFTGRGYGRGVVSMAGRAAQATGRAAARGAMAAARTGAGAVGGTAVGQDYVPVRRFRVQSLMGAVDACVLVGDLDGDEPRHGDIVRVTGRRTRRHVVVVRRLEVLASPAGPVISELVPRDRGALLERGTRVAALVVAAWVVWLLVAS